MKGKAWTKPDWTQAQSLLASGWTNLQVAEMFGRSAKQVQQKAHYQSLSASRREAMKQRTNSRRQAIAMGKPRSERRVPSLVIFERAPPELFDERKWRQSLQPRSLTAEFFGDPLPGYSALDRRT